MPICKKCDKKFPRRINLDGKERHLSNRKYCLKCSPFGKHNTTRLHETERTSAGQHCRCSICDREYSYSKKSGHTTQKCNSCMVNARRIKLKDRMIEYKGGQCIHCGYCRSVQALEFHHRNPATKKFVLSGSHCRRWEIIKKELDKCDLVCSNCHREIGAGFLVDEFRTSN